MGLRINQNVAAMNSYRNLAVTDGQMTKSLERLSSGFRINRAADDAAGLAISEGLRSQVSGLKVAVRNAQDGISVVQTAEGALTEVHSILQRMRDLSVQAANGQEGAVAATTAQTAADTEFQELALELDRIATTTKFGDQALLDGNFEGEFQVDWQDTADLGGKFRVDIAFDSDLDGTGTGVDALGLGVDTTALTGGLRNADSADLAIVALDAAIAAVSTTRSTLGAAQNRLEHTVNNLNVSIENLSASESRIRDTDMAEEMVSFTRAQILSQAGTSMLAQANQAPQGVLSLLR
jgi:flagellin